MATARAAEAFGPLTPDDISQTIALCEQFQKEIKEGGPTSGDKLPSERDLQQQLGIRRLSLKEGSAQLTAKGIIKILPGKGACVAREIKGVSLNNVLVSFLSD